MLRIELDVCSGPIFLVVPDFLFFLGYVVFEQGFLPSLDFSERLDLGISRIMLSHELLVSIACFLIVHAN